MAPTKQQWEKIQDELSPPYGQAFFRCDGYLIHAYVQQSKMKLVIAIYTNGVMSGKHQWTGKESQISQMNEVSRRFWCWHKKAPSAREKKQNERIFGKRKCQERRINGVRFKVMWNADHAACFKSFVQYASHCRFARLSRKASM